MPEKPDSDSTSARSPSNAGAAPSVRKRVPKAARAFGSGCRAQPPKKNPAPQRKSPNLKNTPPDQKIRRIPKSRKVFTSSSPTMPNSTASSSSNFSSVAATLLSASPTAKALAALDHGHFDAVLMDEEMPHMTGVEATRAIRDREKGGTAHQFIIGITGNTTFEDERRLLEAGMDAFLTKPVHIQKLYQTVEAAAHKSDPAAVAAPDASGATATPAAPVMAPNLIVGTVARPTSPEGSTPEADKVDLRSHLAQMTGGNEKTRPFARESLPRRRAKNSRANS